MDERIICIRDQIKTLNRAKPFAPYVIIRKNGARHEVKRAFGVAFNEIVIVITPEDDTGSDFFRLDQIADVEIHEPVS
jgi:hypothetical protein